MGTWRRVGILLFLVSIFSPSDFCDFMLFPKPINFVNSTPVESGQTNSHVKHTTIITLDDNSPPKHETNNTDKYDINCTIYSTTFEFKDGSKCVKLKYKSNTVWSYDEEEHQNKFPKRIIFDTSHPPLITLWFGHRWSYTYKFTAYINRWELRRSQTDGKGHTPIIVSNFPKHTEIYSLDLSKFTVITADDDSGINSAYNDNTKYQMQRLGKTGTIILYKFNSSKCLQLNYQGDVVWKYDSKLHTGFPTLIKILLTHKLVVVNFSEDFFTFKLNHLGKFVSEKADEACALCTSNNSTQLYTPVPTQVTPTPTDLAEQENKIELDIRDKCSTQHLDYTQMSNVGTYVIKTGVSIQLVKKGATEIWRSLDPSLKAVKIVVERICSEAQRITIFFADNQILQFSKYKNKPWIQVSPTLSGIESAGSQTYGSQTIYSKGQDLSQSNSASLIPSVG